MNYLKNAIGHFKTITKHKLLVTKTCFKAGLYKQGLLHDLSKYTPTEFVAGIKYWQGDKSPNSIQKKVEGVSYAWLHHKGRNKHHFNYWIDYRNKDELPVGFKIPYKYVYEMFIDRMCACKNYQGSNYTNNSPLEYYNKEKEHMLIHKDSRELLEFLLNKLANEGEKEVLKYIKDNR